MKGKRVRSRINACVKALIGFAMFVCDADR
jgi:hypothetical protein